MANAFLKPTALVNTVVQALQSEIVLPGLVWRNGLGDFAGKYNDTITIRIPQPTTANTRVLRGTGAQRNLVVSDLTELSVPVTLDTDVYNLVVLTDEEQTLDIFDYAEQVLMRQVDAVARQLEAGTANMITGAPYTSVHQAAADAIWDGVVHARRQLNDAFVPTNGRVLVIGSAVEEALLLDDRFTRYDSAGQAGANALQEARIGRLGGYDVVLCNAPSFPHGAAYLFHPTAFALVSRPPAAPMSGADRVSAVGSAGGFALRWLGDYDPSVTSDRSLVDCFVGYKAIVDPGPNAFVRGARIQLNATSATVGNTGAVTAAAGANHTRQLTLVDNNGDDRHADTGAVVWASSDPTKATVSTSGLVTGVAAGSTSVTAVFDGLTKTWAATVS